MANPKLNVAIPAELAEWVANRHEMQHDNRPISAQCITDLWTLKALLGEELRRQQWSLDDLAEIASALNGTLPDSAVPQGVGQVYAAVYDAHRDRPTHPSEQKALSSLLDRLGALGPTADMALADAVSEWWRDGEPHTAAGWSVHGVRVTS